MGVGVAVVVLLAALVVAQLAAALPRSLMVSPSPTATIDWGDPPVGADASWPSCTPPHATRHRLPLADRPAFVIVGVNDGLPGTTSACIGRELAWADTVTGGSSQPDLAYYVMAADPWTKPELKWVKHPIWPTSGTIGGRTIDVPAAFGADCTGGHTQRSCAYLCGRLMAAADAALPGLRSPATHRFWIDVEAVRTFSGDTLFNQAIVEGMVAGFTAKVADGGVGTTVGVYSTYGEWSRITGTLRPGSPLDALDQWIAVGGTTKARAVAALRRNWPLTPGGHLVMVQYLDGAIDRNVAAPAS